VGRELYGMYKAAQFSRILLCIPWLGLGCVQQRFALAPALSVHALAASSYGAMTGSIGSDARGPSACSYRWRISPRGLSSARYL
jgi:hypothetical protein